MVKVKYGEPYRTSFRESEDKFKAGTLEGVVEKIEEKYKGKDFVETIRIYSMILYNNRFISKIEKDGNYVYDLSMKLKKDDELLFMMLVGGG